LKEHKYTFMTIFHIFSLLTYFVSIIHTEKKVLVVFAYKDLRVTDAYRIRPNKRIVRLQNHEKGMRLKN